MITSMTLNQIEKVVGVHLRSFPGFFLSFLGPQFLHLYYESIVDYEQAVGYVYVEDGQVLGFVCGTAGTSGFYSYLLRTHLLRFAIAALGAAIRKPSIVPRLARALRYPSQTSRREDSATLTSIAVDPAHQNRGIGAELVGAFLREMRRRGIRAVYLTTDREYNDQVNAFYLAMGFVVHRTYVTPEGRAMNKYMITLDGAAK